MQAQGNDQEGLPPACPDLKALALDNSNPEAICSFLIFEGFLDTPNLHLSPAQIL